MQVWRLAKARFAETAFTGEGSRLFSARWNPAGIPMVYTSTSLALAAVELFVNLNPPVDALDLVVRSAILPLSLEVEDLPVSALPPDWKDGLSTQQIGAAWAITKRSAALRVPSAAIEGDWNVLLNPAHPDFSQIELLPAVPWHFDSRMFRLGR